MRLSFVLYAALYVALELVGHQLSLVPWQQITPIMVATAVTDALLLGAVAVAALATADLTRPRWQPAVEGWVAARLAQRRAPGGEGDDAGDAPIDVPSWRAEAGALTPGRARPAPSPVYGSTYGHAHSRPFPEDDGVLL